MENLQLKESLFTGKTNQTLNGNNKTISGNHMGTVDENGFSYRDLLQQFQDQSQNSAKKREQDTSAQSKQPTPIKEASAETMLNNLSFMSSGYNAASHTVLGSSAGKNVESQKVLMGDFNDDGTLDIDDVLAIQDHITEKRKITDSNIFKRMDLNSDGEIDVFDLTKLTNTIIGREEKAYTEIKTQSNTNASNSNVSLGTPESKRLSFNESDLTAVKRHIVKLDKIIDKEMIDKFDFDGDGKIRVVDLSRLEDMLNFDINGDGLFDNSDAQAIRDFLNGKNSLPDKAVQRIEGIYEEKPDALKDIMSDIVKNFTKKESAFNAKIEYEQQQEKLEKLEQLREELNHRSEEIAEECNELHSSFNNEKLSGIHYNTENETVFFSGKSNISTERSLKWVTLSDGEFYVNKSKVDNPLTSEYHIQIDKSSANSACIHTYDSSLLAKRSFDDKESKYVTTVSALDGPLNIDINLNKSAEETFIIYGGEYNDKIRISKSYFSPANIIVFPSGGENKIDVYDDHVTIYGTEGKNVIESHGGTTDSIIISGSKEGNTIRLHRADKNLTIENLSKNDTIDIPRYSYYSDYYNELMVNLNDDGSISLTPRGCEHPYVTLKGKISGEAKIKHIGADGVWHTTTINELLDTKLPDYIQPEPIIIPVNPTPPPIPNPNPSNVVALKNGDTFEITGKVTLHIDDHGNVDQATFNSKNDTLIYHATTDDPIAHFASNGKDKVITLFAPKGEEKVDYADVQGSAKITLDNDGHINISSIDAPIKVYTFEDSVSVSALTGDNYISLSGKNGEVHIGNGNDVIEIRAEGANISSDGGNNVYKFLPFGKNTTINNFNSDKDKLEFRNSLGKLEVELDFMDTVIKSKDGTVIARLANLHDKDSFSKIQKMIEEHNNSLLVDGQQGIKITPGKKIEGYVGETGGVVISDLVTSSPNNGMINVSMKVHNMKSTNAMVTVYNSDGTVYKTYPIEKFQRLPADLVEVGERLGDFIQDTIRNIQQGKNAVNWDDKASATHTPLTFDVPVGGRIEITTNSVQNSELAMYNAVDFTVDLMCSLMGLVSPKDGIDSLRKQFIKSVNPKKSDTIANLYREFLHKVSKKLVVESSIEEGRNLIFEDCVKFCYDLQGTLDIDIGKAILNNVKNNVRNLSESVMDAAASVAVSLAPGGAGVVAAYELIKVVASYGNIVCQLYDFVDSNFQSPYNIVLS